MQPKERRKEGRKEPPRDKKHLGRDGENPSLAASDPKLKLGRPENGRTPSGDLRCVVKRLGDYEFGPCKSVM